jgi:hypothetical protein
MHLQHRMDANLAQVVHAMMPSCGPQRDSTAVPMIGFCKNKVQFRSAGRKGTHHALPALHVRIVFNGIFNMSINTVATKIFQHRPQ